MGRWWFVVLCIGVVSGCGGDNATPTPPPPPPPGPGLDASVDARAEAGNDGSMSDGEVDGGVPDAALDATATPCARDRLFLTTGSGSTGELGLMGLDGMDPTRSMMETEDPSSYPAALACNVAVLEQGLGRIRIQNPDLPFSTRLTIELNRARPDDLSCEVDEDCACPEGDPFCGTTGACVNGRCPTRFAVNPIRGFQASSGAVFVLAKGLNSVLVVNPWRPGVDPDVDDIDLSGFLSPGDLDGQVDIVDAIQIENRIYVALGNYWFDSTGMVSFEGSKIAVIDTDTATLLEEETIDLLSNNPWRGLVHVQDMERNELWVVSPGDNRLRDGQVEAIDLGTGESRATLIREDALGGELEGLVYVDRERAYLLVDRALYRWNPETGEVEDTALATSISGGFYGYDGFIYAWGLLGVRIFDGASEMELTPTSGPIDFGGQPVLGMVAAASP